MTSKFTRLLSGSGLAALVVASVIAAGSATSVIAAPLPTQGLEYVALGDSYAAGYGLAPLTGTPVPGCLQSSSNYPHQLATALGLVLNDRTCTGAVTANILTTPEDTSGFPGGGIAPIQIASLSASTDVVTVSIGGNDLGFADVAKTCVALAATGPVNLPGFPLDCKSFYFPTNGVDTLAVKLQNLVTPALATTFSAIKAAAPNAKVFVVSYPSIAPDAANTPAPVPPGCFTTAIPNGFDPPFSVNSFPFTVIDTPYLHSTEEALDAAIAQEAATAGFTYVPVFDQTASHSACQTDGTAYVNGISISSVTTTPSTVVNLLPGALHPNQTGANFMAAQTLPLIAAAFPAHALAATGGEVSPALGIAALLALLGGVTLVTARRLRTRNS